MTKQMINGSIHISCSPNEYHRMSLDDRARAAVIIVVSAKGESVTVKNKWGAQAPLPAGWQ